MAHYGTIPLNACYDHDELGYTGMGSLAQFDSIEESLYRDLTIALGAGTLGHGIEEGHSLRHAVCALLDSASHVTDVNRWV